MQWVAKKAATKMTVETLQEWQNTLSEDLSGKVGQWKKLKKNLTRHTKKSSQIELKIEYCPELMSNCQWDAHPLEIFQSGQ